MGFDEGSIILDSETGQYYSGQTIYGKLVFDQSKEKSFRGLYVKLKGVCKVHWTTTHHRNENGRSVSYHETHESNEEYFNQKMYLLGGETGEYTLEPGHHELSFQYHIPPNCPSSFEGSHGHVRYEIKAVVDRAFKLDQEKKREVRVIAPLDLNSDPYCKEPMVMTFEDTYCCCCMSSGYSETLIKVPVSGFCPGQNIPIEVSCKNQSSVEIDLIRFYLKREVTFQAEVNPDTKTEENTITEFKQGPVPANSKREFNCELQIPIIDVYNLNSCRFIDIEYALEVVVEPDGCHENSEASRRVVIGTIPLVGFQDNVRNPLLERMPQTNMSVQQFPANNIGFAITSQPYPNSNAMAGNQTFMNNTPYPMPPLQYPANPGYPTPNTALPAPNSGYPAPNAGYPAPNAGYPAPNTGFPVPNTGYPVSTSPFSQKPPYPTPNQQTMANPNYNVPYSQGGVPPVSGGQAGYPTGSPYPPNSMHPVVTSAMQPPVNFGFTAGDPSKDVTTPLLVKPSAPEPSTPDTIDKPFV